jgi:hypothetical protein
MDYYKLSDDGSKVSYFVIEDKLVGEVGIDKHSFKQIDKIHKSEIIKSIPFNYMRYIQKDDGDLLLTIAYGRNSYMSYEFSDSEQRKEAIEKIASSGRVKDVTVGKDSIFRTIKKPVIAFLVLLLISSWSYATAIELESGDGRGGYLVIILLVAGLGSTYIPIIFGLLLCVISYRIYHLLNRRSSITRIYFS